MDLDPAVLIVRSGRLADVVAAFFAPARFAVTFRRVDARFLTALLLAGAGVEIGWASFGTSPPGAPRSVEMAPDTALVNAFVSASTPPTAVPIAPPTRSAVLRKMSSFLSLLLSGRFAMVQHLSAKPGLCDSIEVKYLALVALLLQLACVGGAEQRSDSPLTTWRAAGSWSGRGSAQLATFPTGGGPLRIHWEAHNESPRGAARLAIRLHSADSGRVLAEVADQNGEGAGTKDLADEHQRFYLTVDSANVDWAVRVEEAVTRSR